MLHCGFKSSVVSGLAGDRQHRDINENNRQAADRNHRAIPQFSRLYQKTWAMTHRPALLVLRAGLVGPPGLATGADLAFMLDGTCRIGIFNQGNF
jgi:hypothetical protein